jgi:FHS family L-fucose permease-like MFS transporter
VIWKQAPGIDGSSFWGMMGNMMNFLAYLFMGIPAGKLITNHGYKKTTLIGVGVGFCGVLVQFLSGKIGVGATLAGLPANFFVYLLGAFICGFSVCILNTVVNPMLNLLGGGGNRGNQLVQIGGSFNSLMGTVTPMLVGALIGAVTAETQIADVNTVLFMAMGVFAATFCILIFVPFVEPEQDKTNASVKSLFQYRHLVFGVIAIFLYVGVEIGIPGTLNFFLADSEKGAGLDPATAASIAGSVAAMYWLLMLCGRFVSSFISGKVSSKMQLTVTSAVAIVLVVLAMFTSDIDIKMPVLKGFSEGFAVMTLPLSALLLVLCGLCTSVMWGTIFNLSVEGLGKQSALASGLFMTMVVGGGVLPLVQNAIADAASYMVSYWVIVAALVYILWFAVLGSKAKNA